MRSQNNVGINILAVIMGVGLLLSFVEAQGVTVTFGAQPQSGQMGTVPPLQQPQQPITQQPLGQQQPMQQPIQQPMQQPITQQPMGQYSPYGQQGGFYPIYGQGQGQVQGQGQGQGQVQGQGQGQGQGQIQLNSDGSYGQRPRINVPIPFGPDCSVFGERFGCVKPEHVKQLLGNLSQKYGYGKRYPVLVDGTSPTGSTDTFLLIRVSSTALAAPAPTTTHTTIIVQAPTPPPAPQPGFLSRLGRAILPPSSGSGSGSGSGSSSLSLTIRH